ncbi:hypothetical protein CAPI_07435 [Corynebacterium capitovis DSM 44611]|uniref:zf-HC2 domain-containing protein n=1 Tax=Corynebacterium capitovis TaxID=131081 RepID=UPI00037A27D5|nr:zf-HC2 domain-containing protein [Corynebacterium capitovis]WKD58025.1 hypothetical protein CAPI_07435 [Corynebacterium capitovis DSM 44611]
MVEHEEVQAALSARVDGEPSTLDWAVVDAHLEHCEECRRYWDQLLTLSRTLRVGQFEPPRDLSQVILAGVESEWRRVSRRRALVVAVGRVLLGSAAVVWVMWAVGLLTGVDWDADAELARLLVSTSSQRLGVAVALGFAAWKPRFIPGIALVVGTMFTFTLGFAVRDAVDGEAGSALGHVAILLFSLFALAVTWAADRGVDAARLWSALGSGPTSS